MFQMSPGSKDRERVLSPGLKLWLSLNGKGVFGKGKWLLLDAVKREGSLQAAAGALGISYRKAWGDLREAEKELGISLMMHHRGGPDGGSSTLTDEGMLWWKEYARFHDEVEKHVSDAFRAWIRRMER